LCATIPVHFVITDGIVMMEGTDPTKAAPGLLALPFFDLYFTSNH
jgi:hypothetical protein